VALWWAGRAAQVALRGDGLGKPTIPTRRAASPHCPQIHPGDSARADDGQLTGDKPGGTLRALVRAQKPETVGQDGGREQLRTWLHSGHNGPTCPTTNWR